MERPPIPSASPAEIVLAHLAIQGVCDAIALERARAVARETGLSPAQALVRLGLVSERALAECLGGLLALPLAGPERYPESPVLPERLRPRFLRAARCLPLALEQAADGSATLAIAMADPLDEFAAGAIALATGLALRREVAIPIELEAASPGSTPRKSKPRQRTARTTWRRMMPSG